MNQDELISELLQALTNDVQKLSQQVGKLPTQPPAGLPGQHREVSAGRAGIAPAIGQTRSRSP